MCKGGCLGSGGGWGGGGGHDGVGGRGDYVSNRFLVCKLRSNKYECFLDSASFSLLASRQRATMPSAISVAARIR